MAAMYGSQRVSSQESNLVAGRKRSSTAPMPDIWPEKATPATSAARPEAASAARMVRCADASISSRSCSTHPGRGECSGTSSKASPSSLPSRSTTAALVPIVPRSQPTKTGIRLPPVPRVGDDLRAVVASHDQHREPGALDCAVVVAGVADVRGEEHQRLPADVHAAVGPAARDVGDGAAADRLDGVAPVLGGHDQPSLPGQAEVDLGPVADLVEVALGHEVLAAGGAGLEHGGRAEQVGAGGRGRDGIDPVHQRVAGLGLLQEHPAQVVEAALHDLALRVEGAQLHVQQGGERREGRLVGHWLVPSTSTVILSAPWPSRPSSTAGAPPGVLAKACTRPPTATLASAQASGSVPGAATTATDGARPSSACGSWPGSRTTSAPSLAASARRSGERWVTATVAPAAWSAHMHSSPMLPAPTTSAVSPRPTPRVDSACRQQASGSSRGTRRRSSPATGTAWAAGTQNHPASPPSRSSPTDRLSGQRFSSPARQWGQRPQPTSGWMTTGVPSSRWPAASWPGM